MATLYATEASGYLNSPVPSLPAGAIHGGRMRVYRAKITLASQATTDTIVLARIHRGQRVCFGILTSSVTLGTATIAIGITGTTGKYRAAATFTAVDTPTLFGPAASVAGADPIATDEDIFITIATAALPASGTLVVDLYISGT
jgi:hypothetical protein